MVFNRRNRNPSIAERQFSVSEWNDAPVEQVTGSAHPSSQIDFTTMYALMK